VGNDGVIDDKDLIDQKAITGQFQSAAVCTEFVIGNEKPCDREARIADGNIRTIEAVAGNDDIFHRDGRAGGNSVSRGAMPSLKNVLPDQLEYRWASRNVIP